MHARSIPSPSTAPPALDVGAFDHTAAFVLVLDCEGRLVHYNQACVELTGRPVADVRGLDVLELLRTPEDAVPRRTAFLGLQDAGAPVAWETAVVAGDGERRWIQWSNRGITDGDGHLEYVIASGIDITDRKQIEERLQHAREDLERKDAYLRGVFEHTFELMGLLTPDGTLLEANTRALEFAGTTRDAVVGHPFWETPWWTHDPAVAARLREGIAEAARGQFVRFETTHTDRAGQLVVMDFSLMPVRDDRGAVIFLVPEGRDITARTRAEQWQSFLADVGSVLATTLEYEETLRNIAALAVRSLADCCIVDLVDERGSARRVTVAHAAASRPWFADVLERIPLDRRRPHLAWAVLEGGGPILLEEVDSSYAESLMQDDEHLRALQALDMRSLMVVPLLARGRLLGALSFVAAGGRRKFGPDDLRLAQDLADRAALAVENARFYRVAQDAIQARDDVLGIVAHDLRNPLQAITAAATLQQRFLLTDAKEGTRKAIDVILHASERANRLVADLLEVRRLTA